jgi:hypothetical protein
LPHLGHLARERSGELAEAIATLLKAQLANIVAANATIFWAAVPKSGL